MLTELQALFTDTVKLSSSLLGRQFPLGWLWQSTTIEALHFNASHRIRRTSTKVEEIPPTEIRCFRITLLERFRNIAQLSSTFKSERNGFSELYISTELLIVVRLVFRSWIRLYNSITASAISRRAGVRRSQTSSMFKSSPR